MKSLSIKSLLTAVLIVGSSALPAAAQDLVPDQNKKGKWGYLNSDGKKVIGYDYNEATAFVDGRAKVKKGNKWGYIDPQGKEVIKIQYTEMFNWNDGRCKVSVGGNVKDDVVTGAKYGYINSRGEVLLKPEYDEIGAFTDGLAYVKKGKKYGYIDESFKFVVPCNFTSIGKFNDKGFCWVADGQKMGVYNTNGDIVIKPQYKHLGTFTRPALESNPIMAKLMKSDAVKKLAKEVNKKAGKGMTKKAMFANFTGTTNEDLINEANERGRKAANEVQEMASGFMTDSETRLFAESTSFDLLGYSFVEQKLFSELDMSKSDYFAVSNQGNVAPSLNVWSMSSAIVDKIGIIDSRGTVIVKPGTYGVVFLPSEGLIPAAKKKGDKYEVNYIYESTGKPLMKKWQVATSVAPFKDGVSIIANGNRQTLIDKNGKTVSGVYELILPGENGIHVVSNQGNYGLLKADGTEILPTVNNVILPERDGLFCIRETSTGTYGYVNNEGKYVIPSQYIEATSFSNGTACVKKDAMWGVIGTDNNTLIDFKWLNVMPFSTPGATSCWVRNDKGWTCINPSTGESIFDNAYANVTNFNVDGISFVETDGKIGCIDREGNNILPLQFSNMAIAQSCLDYLRQNNLTTLKPVEAYRYNLINNPEIHTLRFSKPVQNEFWDY